MMASAALLSARLRVPMSFARSLFIGEGKWPQVVASERQKVEGIQHRVADDPAPMQARDDREAINAPGREGRVDQVAVRA
jgi:hypothetical protein